MKKKINFNCKDCGIDTSKNGCSEYYMVYDHVWQKADNEIQERSISLAKTGYSNIKGMLCIGCIERRLGRMLSREDFDMTLPVNSGYFTYSERLLERLNNF